MAGESLIPPDVRATMEKRGTGIGGNVPENARAAAARARALDPTSVVEEEKAAAAAAAKTEEEDLKTCPACMRELEKEWNFCAKCGADLIRGGAAAKLGIEFTDQDLEDYIFRGYVMREVQVFGKHKILFKSQTAKDIADQDNYLMNGAWRKQDGKDKTVSEFYSRQIQQLSMAATAIQKMDGTSIGDTIEDRMQWFSERGTAFADIVTAKAILFHKALTDFLSKADVLKGS